MQSMTMWFGLTPNEKGDSLTPDLQAIRPTTGANLTLLHALVEGGGWEGALPSAMPDELLLALAKDFREVELVVTKDQELTASSGAPIFAVMNTLSQLPNNPMRDFCLSEQGVVQALTLYQWALEREIISRITGIDSEYKRSLRKAFDELLEAHR